MKARNFLNSRLFLLSLSLLSSCAIYENDFDCPPDIGVPCTSSSDIEAMIIETDKGPDIFLGKDTNIEVVCDNETCPQKPSIKNSSQQRRIWIAPQLTHLGHQVDGHYIYSTSQLKNNREKVNPSCNEYPSLNQSFPADHIEDCGFSYPPIYEEE
ncbi:hypothetical protein [Candidatus Protochlamydia phocaeensis]|uniref:hypothetical protein n=1 Tax=Candidatus Protochlamydia phocaeensis TaxID=1414722 RepID=UPI0008383DD7|nr:hypothetical protein [Candidatus Protochlamydia phocaeensis]